MQRRALVIGACLGAPARGPAAEEVDAERMTRMLSGRGFEVEELRGAGATRSGILAGYRGLVERTAAGDAAVVYYSGHGGMVVDAEARGGAAPRRLQYIAPTDYAQTTEDDFRGVSAWELALLLEELTRKTDNVTVILDCCHAAQMSRDGAAAGAVPRAVERPIRIDIGKHYDWVCRHVGDLRRLSPRGNPRAVRLVACGEWQSAYPTVDAHGVPTGLFTHELLATLDEIGEAPVPWRAIHAAVRTRVLRRVSAQRPIVEGPANRQPFTTRVVDRTSFAIVPQPDALLRIDAGRLTGISVGDIYGVTRVGAAGFTAGSAIARVQVDRVAALHAIARPIEWFVRPAALPADSIVWPLALALARHPVRIDAPADDRAALAAAIDRSARLRVAAEGELATAGLCIRDGRLAVIAGDGRPLEHSSGAWAISDAVRRLDHRAAAQTLRELEGEHGLADEDVEVEWGTLQRGVRIPQPAHGAALGLGDRIYLRLRNRTGTVRFAHVFNIGLRDQITLLSRVAEEGVRLGPEQEVLVTTADPESGFELCWPEGLPADEPGVDTLMVVVTTRPADLRALETEDGGARRHALLHGTPLQQLASQVHEGGTRSVADPDPFFVVRRSYVLHPLAAAIAGPGFAIDEDPLAVHAVLRPEGRPEAWLGGAARAARPTRPIEVRLEQLRAERAVRIDALVCTRSADRLGRFLARTIRVAAGAHEGEVVWSGPVTDLLDIYLWIAPDRDARGLGELLAPVLANRADVQQALGALVATGAGEPWSLAGGASMALARAAGEVLREAAPATATEGLLHTSYAAHEGYGIDRPACGLYRAHGVAFGLSIAELGAPAR